MTQRMRKKTNYDAHSRQRALEQRVAKLEKRVEDLEAQQASEKLRRSLQLRPTRRRGRPAEYKPYIFSIRDDIVRMLEEYWPELQLFFAWSDKSANIKAALESIARRPEHIPGGHDRISAQHLLDHFDTLVAVLSSDRFRGDPRQVANAMAGVPDIGWWRSLKICGETPCSLPVGERAVREYLRRKHKRLYEILVAADDPSLTLQQYRTRDRLIIAMQSDPRYAAQIWQAGVADISRLK